MTRKRPSQGGFSKRQAAEAAERRKAQQNKNITRMAGILAVGVILTLIASIYLANRPETASTGGAAAETGAGELPPEARNDFYSAPPPMTLDTSKDYEAIIHTEKGDMRFKLFDDQAPVTVNNFIFLARDGFYNDTTFHRVLPDFMAQGGDPTGTGGGGPGYQFEDEFDPSLRFDRRGLLAMANAGAGTNGSQFFITFGPTEHLNDAHTIFGELIEGDDVLSSLRLRDPGTDPNPGDKITSIEIVESGG